MMYGLYDESERKKILHDAFPEIITQYPEYITQQQAAEICKLAVKTIRKIERNGELPSVKATNRLLHYHMIKLDDVLAFLYGKRFMHGSQSEYIKRLRFFYTEKYRNYPDGLTINDVVKITGHVKQTVANWMHKGLLKGYIGVRPYRIPKKYLIDFVCGSYYQGIKRRTSIQKADMQGFLDEIKNF